MAYHLIRCNYLNVMQGCRPQLRSKRPILKEWILHTIYVGECLVSLDGEEDRFLFYPMSIFLGDGKYFTNQCRDERPIAGGPEVYDAVPASAIFATCPDFCIVETPNGII
jgi:hypothetical protein